MNLLQRVRLFWNPPPKAQESRPAFKPQPVKEVEIFEGPKPPKSRTAPITEECKKLLKMIDQAEKSEGTATFKKLIAFSDVESEEVCGIQLLNGVTIFTYYRHGAHVEYSTQIPPVNLSIDWLRENAKPSGLPSSDRRLIYGAVPSAVILISERPSLELFSKALKGIDND